MKVIKKFYGTDELILLYVNEDTCSSIKNGFGALYVVGTQIFCNLKKNSSLCST